MKFLVPFVRFFVPFVRGWFMFGQFVRPVILVYNLKRLLLVLV